MSCIYYLLSDDSPIGYWHKNQSDIMHYHHSGAALDYLVIKPGGELEQYRLGSDVLAGEHPQLLVEGGCWKATCLCASANADFALISEAVVPEFNYADMELGTTEGMRAAFPQHWDVIAPLLKQEHHE